MKSVIVLENLRSAYNVGNIIRTAGKAKVAKTALGAENHVGLRLFENYVEALQEAKKLGYRTLAAEITDKAMPLQKYKNG